MRESSRCSLPPAMYMLHQVILHGKSLQDITLAKSSHRERFFLTTIPFRYVQYICVKSFHIEEVSSTPSSQFCHPTLRESPEQTPILSSHPEGVFKINTILSSHKEGVSRKSASCHPTGGSLQSAISYANPIQSPSLAAGNNVALRTLSSRTSTNLRWLTTRLHTRIAITILGRNQARVVQRSGIAEVGVDAYNDTAGFGNDAIECGASGSAVVAAVSAVSHHYISC